MKKKELEMTLQQIPPVPTPHPQLEQYKTPATIATDIVFTAFQLGDIAGKTVVDLGCGTGIFSIGAALLGATHVQGFDIDPASIEIAQSQATKIHVDVDFTIKDIQQVEASCDTVIMNPPFGAQKTNQQADRRFMETARRISTVIYSLHLQKTLPFVETLIRALGSEITHQKTYTFPIPYMFSFHSHPTQTVDVILLRTIGSP